MKIQNQTILSEFIILGFQNLQELQYLLFSVFLTIYLFTMLWNTSIITIAILDQNLRTPMYFFLGNLSFLDICYTSTTIPQMLNLILKDRNSISYTACVLQLYFFFSFVGTECLLLAVMALDRYVAICNPLHYSLFMRRWVCFQLAIACWIGGFLNSAIHTYFAFQLPFCGDNFLEACSSHLTVVLLYYGSCIFTYLRPVSSQSSVNTKLIPLMYSILTPLLNPVIYTLRNKDVKNAWRSIMGKI
ncbi:olfactory receptor 5V1-like [Notechis scutatus]|uniref:Olfactory receptor 5V1-like n=1 Tax=Notechis scutatus TaxID=8663 RepID=A0A6J1VN78_9SAUR|nr:olfactory receptor 5V1-like [Notechis scutatus]